jgi:hypothetical protein
VRVSPIAGREKGARLPPCQVFQTRAESSSGRLSIGGGISPRWGRDGRELYYDGQRGIMAVDVETEPVLRVGTPKLVFEGHFPWHGYDVTADGRFLVRRPRETVEGPLELKVILNWFGELERLAPHPLR